MCVCHPVPGLASVTFSPFHNKIMTHNTQYLNLLQMPSVMPAATTFKALAALLLFCPATQVNGVFFPERRLFMF